MLYGRDVELLAIDSLLDGARSSKSGVLVMRGEPGVGKSALLEEAVNRASGMQVLEAEGIETESELAFAALHQLLRPLLERLKEDPGAAVGRASRGRRPRTGHSARSFPDLSRRAEPASSRGGARAAAVRRGRRPVARQAVGGGLDLQRAGSRPKRSRSYSRPAKARSAASRHPPARAAARRARARGSRRLARAARRGPALSRAETALAGDRRQPARPARAAGLLSEDQLAGQAPLAEPLPVGATLEAAFLERARGLPPESQALLLIAAADDTGDPAVVLRGAREMRIEAPAFGAAEAAGLIRFGEASVEFRHPLIRSAVYQGASLPERQEVHEVLADLLEGEEYADRRAWHLAAATSEPNPEIAEELERTADRARRRSGYAAAAALRARRRAHPPTRCAPAGCSPRPMPAGSPADRTAGAPGDGTPARIASATAGRHRPPARNDRVRVASPRPPMGSSWRAAGVAPLDARKALQMLVSAGEAAGFSGDFSKEIEVSRQAEELTQEAGADGFETSWVVGVGSILDGDLPKECSCSGGGRRGAGVRGSPPAYLGWGGRRLSRRPAVGDRVLGARRSCGARYGAIGALPIVLGLLAAIEVVDGRLASAAVNASEGLDLSRDTGQENSAAYHLAILARVEALRGREQECRDHAAEAFELASAHGLHFQAATATWALGQLELGLGRPAEALSRFESLATVAPGAAHPIMALYTTPDLVEAAVRADRSDLAEPGLQRFAEWADATGSPWALALVALPRAALSWESRKAPLRRGPAPPSSSRAVIRGRATELAGEFLRREGERKEAREHLRRALDVFGQVGAAPWAERARTELRASGESTCAATRARSTSSPARAPDRTFRRRGRHQPPGGRTALPQPPHDRLPPAQHLPQARHQLPQRAGPVPHGSRRGRSEVSAGRARGRLNLVPGAGRLIRFGAVHNRPCRLGAHADPRSVRRQTCPKLPQATATGMLMTSGGAAQRRVRNDLRSANAAWPEYCCHREAGCRVNEASDLLFANGRAAALAFPRRAVASVATDLVTAPDDFR